jgi:serine protease
MHFHRLSFAIPIAALVLSACSQGGGPATNGAPTSSVLPQIQSYSQHQVNRSYRHGLIPMRNHAIVGRLTGSTTNLEFQGGIDGVGVTTGKPKIYLVFWGSQWGTQSTNGQGYITFSGDPQGMAPVLQAFFKGLGTGGELWSGVMTQYCQGVAVGKQFCSTANPHVGYPTGGALAGVWEDTSAAAPTQASGHQIAVEAEAAAAHFGNTTATLNRHVQYDIISPTGTNPDNYQGQGFCAWHDYTGDAYLDGGGGASGPLLAFTNMPYVTDVGSSCGAGFVNPGNNLDGVTIVNGHEWAETITDQFPAGGWIDPYGEETGDLCAWISSGQGASANLVLTTGTFAVQSTWSNHYNNGAGGCVMKHRIAT